MSEKNFQFCGPVECSAVGGQGAAASIARMMMFDQSYSVAQANDVGAQSIGVAGPSGVLAL